MNADRVRARRLASQLLDLRTAACALADALVLLDQDDRVQWSNPAAQRLLGIVWPRDRGSQMIARFGDGEIGAWFRARRDEVDDVSSPADENVRLQLKWIP